MRRHDDEVATSVLGCSDNGLIGMRVLHLNRVAGDTGLLGRIYGAIQRARGVLLDRLGIFCGLLRPPCHFCESEPDERFHDNDYGYFGSQGFRQRQPIRHPMLRQLRSICWNENMPIHAPPLGCLDVSPTLPSECKQMTPQKFDASQLECIYSEASSLPTRMKRLWDVRAHHSNCSALSGGWRSGAGWCHLSGDRKI